MELTTLTIDMMVFIRFLAILVHVKIHIGNTQRAGRANAQQIQARESLDEI